MNLTGGSPSGGLQSALLTSRAGIPDSFRDTCKPGTLLPGIILLPEARLCTPSPKLTPTQQLLTFYLRQAPLGLLCVFSLLLELVQLSPEELTVVGCLLPQVLLLGQLGFQLADPALQLQRGPLALWEAFS